MSRPAWGPERIDALIAQRAPFRFLDAIHAFDDARGSLHGSFSVPGDHPFLAGHFPGTPIWPGVCTIEGMAQACGALATLLHGSDEDLTGISVMGTANVRLLAPVRPPVRLDYHVLLEARLGPVRRFRVHAAVGAVEVARGTLTGSRVDLSPVGT